MYFIRMLKYCVKTNDWTILGDAFDLRFNYQREATADNGCGVTFMGEFWYFGDDTKVSHTQNPEDI